MSFRRCSQGLIFSASLGVRDLASGQTVSVDGLEIRGERHTRTLNPHANHGMQNFVIAVVPGVKQSFCAEMASAIFL